MKPMKLNFRAVVLPEAHVSTGNFWKLWRIQGKEGKAVCHWDALAYWHV